MRLRRIQPQLHRLPDGFHAALSLRCRKQCTAQETCIRVYLISLPLPLLRRRVTSCVLCRRGALRVSPNRPEPSRIESDRTVSVLSTRARGGSGSGRHSCAYSWLAGRGRGRGRARPSRPPPPPPLLVPLLPFATGSRSRSAAAPAAHYSSLRKYKIVSTGGTARGAERARARALLTRR